MASRTLLELRTRARHRSNMENSTFVSDAEFNNYLNYSICDLRDILISKVGEDYFATSQSFTIIDGTDAYALPADFYKILWVELQLESGSYQKMDRFEISEMVSFPAPLTLNFFNLRYRLRANNLVINPTSGAGGKIVRMWYSPLPTELSADGDTLVGYNGWDEYVVLCAARKALVKEEQDVREIDNELLVFLRRLESMAPNRDQGQPMRIQDNSLKSRCDGSYLWP